MKVVIYLYFVLLIQVKAYFTDELRGALHHVETGFEKLLKNVVTDIEDTLHCTISAVEHILYMHGIFSEPTNYNDKCKRSSKYNVHNPTTRPLKHEDNQSKNEIRNAVNQQIHNSISNVNKTLSEIFGNGVNAKFKGVTGTFEKETNRLNEVSEMLRKELEKISQNVKDGKIGKDYSSKDVIWNEIKSLEALEKSSNNNTEVEEIHDIYNKALSELQSNKDKSDDKLKIIISELEKNVNNSSEVTKGNQEKIKPSDTVQNFRDKEDSLLAQESQKNEITKIKDRKPEISDTVQHFRDKEDAIFNQELSKNKKVEISQEKSETSESTQKFKNREDTLFRHKSLYDDSVFLNFDKKNNPEAVEQARKVIEESEKTEILFKSLSNAGTSVFDSLDFFNF